MFHYIYNATESESVSNSAVSYSSRPHRLLCPWNSPGKNTGGGSYSLLQVLFLTQGSWIAGRFFIIWATRETQWNTTWPLKNKFSICCNLDGLGGHYGKWNKLDRKTVCHLYVIQFHVTNKKKQNHIYRKQASGYWGK